MALEIFHHGRLLTPQQLEVFSKITASGAAEGKSLAKIKKMFDKELEDAGLAVPKLQPNDVVSWENKGNKDRGRIIEIDERTGKLRVMSQAKKREFTVPEAYVKFIKADEEAEA